MDTSAAASLTVDVKSSMGCATAGMPLAHDFGLSAGLSLVCTVWFHKAHNFPTMPQRLGIVYCMNRPCSLYSVRIPFTCKNNTPSDLNPQAKCLTEALLSAASPKFAPGGDKLIFLSHDAAASSGVHHATAALKCLNWSKGQYYSVLICCLHRDGSKNAVTLHVHMLCQSDLGQDMLPLQRSFCLLSDVNVLCMPLLCLLTQCTALHLYAAQGLTTCD